MRHVVHGGGFSDFDFQRFGRQAGFAKSAVHIFDDVRIGELLGGQVHGDAEADAGFEARFLRVAAGLEQNEASDGNDESRGLREVVERGCRTQAFVR